MLPISTAIQQHLGIVAIICRNLEVHLANFCRPYKMAANVCKQKKGLWVCAQTWMRYAGFTLHTQRSCAPPFWAEFLNITRNEMVLLDSVFRCHLCSTQWMFSAAMFTCSSPQMK